MSGRRVSILGALLALALAAAAQLANATAETAVSGRTPMLRAGSIAYETGEPTPSPTATVIGDEPTPPPTPVVVPGTDVFPCLPAEVDMKTRISVFVRDQTSQQPIEDASVTVSPLGLSARTDADGCALFPNVDLPIMGPADNPEPLLVDVTTTAADYAPDFVRNYSLFPDSGAWLLTAELSQQSQVRDFTGLPRAYWGPRGVHPADAPVSIIEGLPPTGQGSGGSASRRTPVVMSVAVVVAGALAALALLRARIPRPR